jgi:hypothetical protein
LSERRRLTRREAIRKGAIVGGNLLWIAPAIQTLTPRAMAHEASGTNTCCQCVRRSVDHHRTHLNMASTPTECEQLCSQQPPAGQFEMEAFHRDSTPFSTSGNGNNVVCSHPDH